MNTVLSFVLLTATLQDFTNPPLPNAEITKLITQLGDDSFKKREAAQNSLEKLEYKALRAVEWARNDKDIEIRHRAEVILNRYYYLDVKNYPSIWNLPKKYRIVNNTDLALNCYNEAIDQYNSGVQDTDSHLHSNYNYRYFRMMKDATRIYCCKRLREGVDRKQIIKLLTSMREKEESVTNSNPYQNYSIIPEVLKDN